MPTTWSNVVCSFQTRNEENTNGNSTYNVTADNMTRFAPVNAQRAPNQVQTGNPNICYLDPNGETYRRVMQTRNDSDITIANVQGDDITVVVQTFVGNAFRRPRLLFCPFDFVNNDGTLTHIHIGHPVCGLAQQTNS